MPSTFTVVIFAKWWFLNILSRISNWNSKKQLSIYPMGRIIHYHHISLFRLFLILPLGDFFFLSSLLYFFNMPPLLFEHFLTFWHHKKFQLILYFACPKDLVSAKFSKKTPLISFTVESSLEIKIWALGMLITAGNHCF